MEYTIVEREAFTVIGIRKLAPYGGGTWNIVKHDGSNEKIREMSGRYFDLGLCFGFHEDGSNDYMCAIEWGRDKMFLYNDFFDSFEYPAAKWLKFTVKGAISANTLRRAWGEINEKVLPESEYREYGLPTIEKYVIWDEMQDRCEVEIWIPVDMKN